MSKRTYIGDPTVDFAKNWTVQMDSDERFRVYVTEDVLCDCGCPNCVTVEKTRLHDKFVEGAALAAGFEDASEASEWIDGLREDLDEDYDQYLEENRYEIVQQERYEMWRREY